MADYVYVGEELRVFAEALNWKSYLRDTIGEFITGDVLEVGAGMGATTRALCTGTTSSWTCLEPDGALATRLSATLSAEPIASAPTVRDTDIGGLGQELCFDCILYVDVLEHILEDRQELTAARRHLRSGGYLIIVGPAHQWLYSAFDEAIGHHRRYTRTSLSERIPIGMMPVMLRYLDFVGVGLSAANRLAIREPNPSARQIRFWDRFVVPLSRRIDPLLRWRVGKTVVGVWREPEGPASKAPGPGGRARSPVWSGWLASRWS